jgi:hypothetical protein
LNLQESRRELCYGQKSSNVKSNQFWQHNNKPIELWSPEVIEQKVEYIHTNPVIASFVTEAWLWQIQALLIIQEVRD